METMMTNRCAREKQLQGMIRTAEGRLEIYRLGRILRGVKRNASMGGMFIGRMIADILAVEFPRPL